MTFKIKNLVYKVLAAGILLGLSWPPFPFGLALLFAFVPLFFYADALKAERSLLQLFLYSFLALCVRNLITLYWIGIVSPAACIGAVIILSSVFSIIIAAYQWYRNYLTAKIVSYIVFVSSWVAAEWFCEEVLKFPWTNLGFGLASQYSLVQWFEYTGIYGGTLWILIVNILIYETYRVFYPDISGKASSGKVILGLATVVIILAPVSYSYFSYLNYRPSMNAIQVVVVQSNIDNLHKFKSENSSLQLEKLIRLSSKAAKENTEYFIWPETALEPWHALNEDSLLENKSVVTIKRFLKAYPNANLITGALTYRVNSKNTDSNWYNSALHIENTDHIQIYHKNKLVPGTETTLFQNNGGKSHGVALYLGGLTKTFSTTPNDIFYAESGMGIAPAICFESVFGEYISHNLVLKGAQLIAVISNDAWWGNSSGTWQHSEYMRLLAIENRRSLACASNGGISSLIDQEGNMISSAKSNTETALSGELLLREEPSFYALHPLYIPLTCLVITILGLLSALFLCYHGVSSTRSRE